MDKGLILADIAKKISDCKRCSLYENTTHSVPGEVNPNSKVVFIGEGPGYNEDMLGRPFVGRAGKLLDKLLLSIGISRKEVFITNVIKHRPPENRDPLPTELSACKYWLDQQLEVMKPKVVVTLGRYSLARYLPTAKISLVHGSPTRAKNLVVIPMYHPAAALRNGSVLRTFEDDFQKNAKILKNPEKVDEFLGPDDENEESDQISLF